jgi:chemotaxis protein MotB
MANPKKYKKKQEEGQPLWLLSYSDLVTQLLVFFVMLYAISGDTLNVAEMRLLLSAFTGLGNYRAATPCRSGAWPSWATR